MALYGALAECQLLSDASIVAPKAKPLKNSGFAIGQAADVLKTAEDVFRGAAERNLIQQGKRACLGSGGLRRGTVASDVIGHHYLRKVVATTATAVSFL